MAEEANTENTKPITEVKEKALELIPTELTFVRGIPEIVDANAALTLQAEVSCTQKQRPTGKVVIFDAEGACIAEAALLTKEEEDQLKNPDNSWEEFTKTLPPDHPSLRKPSSEELERVIGTTTNKEPEKTLVKTAEFTLRAPSKTGEYTWTAKFQPENVSNEAEETNAPAEGITKKEGEPDGNEAPAEKGEEKKNAFAESSLAISFKVRAHLISLSVWNVPIPVTKGEPFNVSIGAACSNGCSLAGLKLHIKTETDAQNAALGNDILSQTKATSWAEIELQAPNDEGIHNWTVECELPQSEHPHKNEPVALNFRTVAPPKHAVTITVVEKHEKRPLEKAYIMLGSYQAISDKQGAAIIKIQEGKHTFSVVLRDYIFDDCEVEITGDTTLTASMKFSPLI